MKKQMDKKAEKEMPDDQYDAKMHVLEELRELAMELMKGKYGDKMKGMQQVSVAAPDQEKLSEGIELAKQLVSQDESPEDDEDEEEDEA